IIYSQSIYLSCKDKKVIIFLQLRYIVYLIINKFRIILNHFVKLDSFRDYGSSSGELGERSQTLTLSI
ncbi:MAG: hypothetical protein ACKO96_10295, partial [Flammeovirgaceae bacterium]